MDYILQLREFIGHRPIMMVGAAILVIDEKNRLLLMKRSDSGCWGPPGGTIEPGEKVENAAKRETLEETGLEICDMSLFGVFSGPSYITNTRTGMKFIMSQLFTSQTTDSVK